jgi:iron complex outermembrane receptor protein
MVANPADPNAYWIIGAMRSNQSTVSATASLFSEWTLAMPKDFLLTGGLGYSNMDIELRDKFYVANNAKPTFYTNTFEDMWSPHLALNKIFNKQVSAYVSYSRGYKAPVSSYFFIPATGQLNTGLKPEMGDQFEIGGKGVLLNNKLTYELALFYAKFKDKMTAIAVPLDGSTTTTAYSYIANGGDQNHKGIELLVKYNLLQSSGGFIKLLRPFGNLAISDFKYDGYSFQTLSSDRTHAVIADYDGKKVAGVAPVTANLGVDLFTKQGFYGNLIYSYKDEVPITSDGANIAHSYNLLNGKIGFQQSLFKHLDLDAYFGVNNITGTQYYLMVFVNQLPDAYLPAPLDVNYFGGINLKYNF